MTRPAPTRAVFKRVLDDIFQRILTDGERSRAEREPGPPPRTPEPQSDPEYEHLDPEEWHTVPQPPERWTDNWRTALMCNEQQDVRALVEDALSAQEVTLPSDTLAWRQVSRLALIVAVRAHEINGQRELGIYDDGWSDSAGIPLRELPGAAASSAAEVKSVPDPAVLEPAAPMPISVSCSAFFVTRSTWSAKTKKQADGALVKFLSLMGDLPVGKITASVAESFRDRLRDMPNLYGKSIYACMTPYDALTRDNHLRAQLKAGGGITLGLKTIELKEAQRLAKETSMKTVNRDFSVFTGWSKWMAADEDRCRLLHREKDLFLGKGFKKSAVKVE